MNINRCASEIDTGVNLAERYASRMADPEDDRAEALAWYFRLLVRQELERMTRPELARRLGVDRGHIHQIENGKVGVGVLKLIAFAEKFGRKPGELLDEALAWWPKRGREEKALALAEIAEKAAERARTKSDRKADRAPESGPKGSGKPPAKAAV